MLGVSSGSVVALIAAASTPGVRDSTVPQVPAPVTRAGDGTAIAVDTARLRARAAAVAESRVTVRRNLFAFVPSARTPVASVRAPEAPTPSSGVRPSDRGPAWQLIGIASSAKPRDSGRTAILNGAGTLQFVAVGEILSDGLRVVAVGDESIELRSDEGHSVVLTLHK
jgi:hypothetical protein